MRASPYERQAGRDGSPEHAGPADMWAAERLISSAALVFLGFELMER